MNLGEAITRVFEYLDDDGTSTSDGSRWTVAQVTQKLNLALDNVLQAYAARGGTRCDQIITATASDGYVDLTAYQPLQIKSVRINAGGIYHPVRQITTDSFSQTFNSNHSISIRLVARPTFPSSNSADFLWGGFPNSPALDELICLRAARLLLTKDGEVDASLETQYRELLTDTLTHETSQFAFDMPVAPSYDWQTLYGFYYAPYGIHLGVSRA
jgi:hypothetical protein